MSRLVHLTIDQIKDMNNSELLTTLEIVRSRIGSGRKNSKPTKELEKTFSYLDDERQRRINWGMIAPKVIPSKGVTSKERK
jgi:hypothetical protein